jgi:hypothetical protein
MSGPYEPNQPPPDPAPAVGDNPGKRSWLARHKAATIAAAAVVALGAAGTAVALTSNHPSEAACQDAIQKAAKTSGDPSEADKASIRSACAGLDDAALNRITRSVIGTAFADAFGTDTTTAATASPDSVGVPTESLPPDPPAYEAVASDFSITLKVKSRDCFGDAGCNVTYVPVLTIVGSQVDQDAGSYSITYEVRGGTDGAEVDTIDVDSGKYDQSEGFAQTARASSKLTAVITDVETN